MSLDPSAKPSGNGHICDKSGNDQDKCLEMLFKVIDGQANADEKAQFENCVRQCQACYQKYNIEKLIKQLVQSQYEAKTVPPQLREDIYSLIQQTPA